MNWLTVFKNDVAYHARPLCYYLLLRVYFDLLCHEHFVVVLRKSERDHCVVVVFQIAQVQKKCLLIERHIFFAKCLLNQPYLVLCAVHILEFGNVFHVRNRFFERLPCFCSVKHLNLQFLIRLFDCNQIVWRLKLSYGKFGTSFLENSSDVDTV